MDLESIIKMMVESSEKSKELIEEKIIDKQRELSGLVSREGAAYIVAKEMGLDLLESKKRRLEIKNIIPGIRNLTLTATVYRVFEPREFEYKGKRSKVANVILMDNTGSVRLSLWDKQTDMLKNLEPGVEVEVFSGYSKEDPVRGVEIRISNRGGIKILGKGKVPSPPEAKRVKISQLKIGKPYEVKAALVQLFETSVFYESCPDCKKRLKEGKCEKHGSVKPEYLVVISGIIDDGSRNIRAVFFRDNALKLIGMDIEEALKHRNNFFDNVDVLGKEYILQGQMRENKMFKRSEFVVNSVQEVKLDGEINKILNSFASNV